VKQTRWALYGTGISFVISKTGVKRLVKHMASDILIFTAAT
jgi:hypothetical protein